MTNVESKVSNRLCTNISTSTVIAVRKGTLSANPMVWYPPPCASFYDEHHEFNKDLSQANHEARNTHWFHILRQPAGFPNMIAMGLTTENMEMQGMGVDRVLWLDNGKEIWIDDKLRRREYKGDFFLETVSNILTGKPGGVCDEEKVPDWIMYAFPLSGILFLLYNPELRAMWRKHGEDILAVAACKQGGYFITQSHTNTPNGEFQTEGVVVPARDLLPLLPSTKVLRWKQGHAFSSCCELGLSEVAGKS